jgi:hypothetical protein
MALCHAGTWPGPDHLVVAGEQHQIIPCVSDLQMREALGELENGNNPGILLCDLDPAAVGEDVLARLVRRQIHHPKKDEMLRHFFEARVVDARILSNRALVQALIQGASAGGYPPVSGGTLDLEFAWKAVLRKQLDIEVAEISFSELLRWTTIPLARNALLKMAPELRGELDRWLEPNCGAAARLLFQALSSDVGADLVALGLLLGLIQATENAQLAEAQVAAARLEQYFGNEPLDALARQTWYQAATSLFDKLVESEVFQAQAVVQTLDRLVERVRLQTCAHLSDHSLMGLEQRLTSAGQAIYSAVEQMSDTQVATARVALEKAAAHRLAADHSMRLRRLRMGLRLVCWLRNTRQPEPEASLSQLISYYSSEGGFVDWARSSIIEADPNPHIKEVLRNVIEKVDARWGSFQHRFACRLQTWSEQNSQLQNVLRIEEVLWSVVAPVAKEHPALLIVLDGMSQAVFRELMSDLIRRNWVELAAPAENVPHTVLATIPSITEVSRRALLCGQLPLPDQGSEKSDFTGSNRLIEQVGGQVKPQLFLKGDLLEAGRMGLSDAVSQAVANSRCRLVGVVVNAVDDSLGAADQTTYSWGLDQITRLHELMRAASEAGRVVILTSDHGHVLDEGSQLVRQPLPETGDRYRLPGGSLSEGEMEFRGPRIRDAIRSESVVAINMLRRRYQGKRRGYHGGVCPAEMVIPCTVLRSSNTAVEIWEDLPPYEPEWWSLRAPGSQVPPATPRKSTVARRPATQKQADLFRPAMNVATVETGWIDKLLVSATYQQQKRAAVRGAPSAEQFKQFLLLLDQRNGRIQRRHLAQQLALPLIRVDGLVQNYRRLLNVDGYDVLSFDQSAETIVLNMELLKSQFEL